MPKLKPVPWLMVLQAGMALNEHWTQNLSARERTRLRTLVTKSKGLPSNLSTKEKAEVKKLVAKLDVPGAGRKLLPLAGRRKRLK